MFLSKWPCISRTGRTGLFWRLWRNGAAGSGSGEELTSICNPMHCFRNPTIDLQNKTFLPEWDNFHLMSSDGYQLEARAYGTNTK